MKISKIQKKAFLEPGAFLDKHFCENCQACNFFAIWLRVLISFLNDVSRDYTLNFRKSFGKKHSVCPKNP